ncbi:MAG: hypothetical protein NT027_06395, partial [Proteobacteria bacterium]|nr:hypothetical protein [Pseudomonadota bacterium]
MLNPKKFIPTILISSVTATFGCRGTGTNTSIAKDIVGIENFACNGPAPESPGQHNMILFGSPNDATYAYHLPLFAGSTNGTTGHVLMHVYQGLWNVTLDSKTQPKYLEAFNRLSTAEHPIPMFSFSPQKKRFKVPEMICAPNFSFPANVVSGHVEGNPDFPAPAPLINENSQITTNGTAMFGRR